MDEYEELPSSFSCKKRINPDIPEGCPYGMQPYVHMSKGHRASTRNEFDPCCKPNEIRSGVELSDEESDVLWMARHYKFKQEALKFLEEMDEDFAAISDYCNKYKSEIEDHIVRNKKKANQMVAELMEVGTALRVELSRCLDSTARRHRSAKEIRTDVVISGCGAMEQILAVARLEFYPRLDAWIQFLESAVSGYDIRKHREEIRKMLADPDIQWYYKPFRYLSSKAKQWFEGFKAWLSRIKPEHILSWVLLAVPMALMVAPVMSAASAAGAVVAGGYSMVSVFEGLEQLCALIDMPIFLLGIMVTLRAWVAAPPEELRKINGGDAASLSVHYAKRILNFLGAGTAVELAQVGWDSAAQLGVPHAVGKAAEIGMLLGKQSAKHVRNWTGKSLDLFLLTLEGFFWLIFYAIMTMGAEKLKGVCKTISKVGKGAAWITGIVLTPFDVLSKDVPLSAEDKQFVNAHQRIFENTTHTEFGHVSDVPVQEFNAPKAALPVNPGVVTRMGRKFVAFIKRNAESDTLKEMIRTMFNMEQEVVDFITYHAMEMTPAFLGVTGLSTLLSFMYMAQTADAELLGNRFDILKTYGKRPISDVLRSYGRITPTPPLAYVYRRCKANGGTDKECREEADESQETICEHLPQGSTMPKEYISLCDRKALRLLEHEKQMNRAQRKSSSKSSPLISHSPSRRRKSQSASKSISRSASNSPSKKKIQRKTNPRTRV